MFLPILFTILGYLSFLTFRWSGLFLGFLTVFLGILLHKFAEFYLEHRKCHETSGDQSPTHPESEAPATASSEK